MTHPEDLTFEERIALLSLRYTSEASVYERVWAPGLKSASANLLDRMDLSGARSVLDVGSGVGAALHDLSARARHAWVIGSDRAEGMIRLAAPRFGRIVADATGLPIATASFDAVTMLFMLFHLPHPVDGLREAHRVLRRGGLIGTATWGEGESWHALEVWNEELDHFGAEPTASLLSLHEYVDTPEKMQMHLRDSRFEVLDSWVDVMTRPWAVAEFIDFATGMALRKQRLESLDPDSRDRFLQTATGKITALPRSSLTQSYDVVFAMGRAV